MSRRLLLTAIEAMLLAVALIALVWLGLWVRRQMWDHSTAVRYVPDMENGWAWGARTAREGFVPLYDRVVNTSAPGEYGLDYMPLRLAVMTLWAHSRLAASPAPTHWQPDYAFNAPLLQVNSGFELLTALGIFAIGCDWRRRDRRQRLGSWPRPLYGVWLATAACALAWLNPASLLSAHVRPTWDVWVIPFYVWAIWFAGRGWWLTAGCVIGAGTLFKGQELIVAPLFILWPLMRFGVASALRFVIGFAISIGIVASPWLVGASMGPIAFVIACAVLPLAIWGVLKRWPIRRRSMSARWLQWMIPAAAALGIGACVPLFGGSINWLRVGLIYGANKFDGLSVASPSSLAAILDEVYHWHPKDPVQCLQWIGFTVTISNLLVAIYGLCLVMIAWAIGRDDRAGDRRFVLAVAAPWLIYFAIFPKMHERYLLWGAVTACLCVIANLDLIGLALFFGVCSSIMSLCQIISPQNIDHFLTEISPHAGRTLAQWIEPTHPGLGWAILLATVIWLWITVTGAIGLPRRSSIQASATHTAVAHDRVSAADARPAIAR